MRFQLALNVPNLDAAIAYYEKLLGAPVNKREPGYANFAVDSPPIKLVLFENPSAEDRLNHVGFETDEPEWKAAAERLESAGVAEQVLPDETCCYADQSTVYSRDPEGLLWEFYTVRGDSETDEAWAASRRVRRSRPHARERQWCPGRHSEKAGATPRRSLPGASRWATQRGASWWAAAPVACCRASSRAAVARAGDSRQ